MNWTLVLMLVWLLTGQSGFAYWWTKDYELKDAPFLFFFSGVLGPISWISGSIIHGRV